MGFEPTTFCLGSRHSTPELHPLAPAIVAVRRTGLKDEGQCIRPSQGRA